jgi:hypothetical protein
MPTPEITPAEAVQTLKRSSLPTIVTEGVEDYVAFRRIEAGFSDIGVSLMPVGGKQTVLEVFKQRREFPHLKVAYVVDRDLWIFTGVPNEFTDKSIILTDGYSIENDLYRDADLEKYFTAAERTSFSTKCEQVCRWFSFAVRQRMNGGDPVLKDHPKRLLAAGQLCPAYIAHCGYTGPCPILFPQIHCGYSRLLRGKTLWQLLLDELSATGRHAQHNYRSLMEVAAHADGPLMTSIQGKLNGLMR